MIASSDRVSAVHTPLGRVQATWSSRGIRSLSLRSASPSLDKGDGRNSLLQRSLRDYCEKGRSVSSKIPLDIDATPFQQRVWGAIRLVPYGQTRSYSWLAARIGKPKAVRAVANACGANPVPILVPCHRIVAKDGTLGGFSAGLHWKRRLLRSEQLNHKERQLP